MLRNQIHSIIYTTNDLDSQDISKVPYYMYDGLWRLPVFSSIKGLNYWHPPLFLGKNSRAQIKQIGNLLRHILQDFAQFEERLQTTVLIM